MTKTSIAFLAAMSLAGFGCRKNQGDADKAGAIAKLTKLKDKMCACKDKTCSDQVSAELAEWGQEQEKSDLAKPASPGEKDDEKLEALKEETANCLLKIEVPSGAGAPGAAAGSAATGSGSNAGGAAADRAGGSAAPAPAAGSATAGSAH